MRLTSRLVRVLLFIFLTLLSARVLLAQGNVAPVVLLTDAANAYSLDREIQVLIDPGGALTFEQVRSPAYANQFMPGEQALKVNSIGGTDWVRFRVRNTSSRSDWLLQIPDTRVPYLDVYRPLANGTTYSEIQTGDFLPTSTREIPDRTFVFRLALPPNAEQTLYLRAQSSFMVELPVVILTPDALAVRARDDALAYGLFYGAMLIMAGYNLIVFLFLRDRAYFYLVLVILGFVASKAAQDGIGHMYVWSQLSNRWTMEYSIVLTMLAVSFFTTSFLQIPTRARDTNRIFNGWRLLVVVVALLVPFTSTLIWIAALMAVEIVMILLAAWRAWQSGLRAARLFLASLLLPLTTGVIYLLYTLGVLPNPYFADRILLAFLAALALLWSLVLVERINALRAEMQMANRSLAHSERQYRTLFEDSRDAIFITTRAGDIVDLNPSGLDLFGYTRSELGQLQAGDLFETLADYLRLQQTLEQAGFVVDYETQMRCQNDTVITAMISSTLWTDEERGLSGYQGILRDISERHRTQAELATYRLHLEELVAARTMQANAELAERRRAESALERRVQELSMLNEIAKTMSSVADLGPALTIVAEKLNQLFQVRATVIGEMDQTAETFRVLANYPQTPEYSPQGDHTLAWDAAPVFQHIRDSNKVILVTDPQGNPILGAVARLLPHAAIETLLWIPLRVGGTLNGILILSSPQKGWFAQGEILNLAETIGTAIATAIENTRLYHQAQVTAVADERQRLARELHDSVTQILYSIVLLAGGHGMEAEKNVVAPRILGEYFNELGELGQQALGEMRLLLYQLRAPVLTEMGLGGALQQRLNAVEQRVGIQTYVYMNGDFETLPLLVQEELFFIAQEALNNALRHAHASEVQLRLVKQGQQVEMAVQDNGNGFDRAVQSEGMGLRNMQVRAQMIDAKLEIKSFPGEGTRVQLDMNIGTLALE